MEPPETEESKKLKSRALKIQCLIVILANLPTITTGMALGYAAVTLPSFREDTNFHVGDDESSWIASLVSISTPIGCLMTGPFLDRFGRKATILAINVPAIIGWLMISVATGPAALSMIYAGRLLTGLSLGICSSGTNVYVSEVARDTLRGMLVTWISIFVSTGIVLSYILGAIFPNDWRTIAIICMAFPIVSFIISIFLPESPVWLLVKGRNKDAEYNFKRARGIPVTHEVPPYFQEEYQKVFKGFEDNTENTRQKVNILKELKKPTGWKPLCIMVTFFFCQQFCGYYIFLGYTVDVIGQFGITFNAYHVAVVVGATRLVVTVIYGIVSAKFGRRVSAISTSICTCIFIICLTTFSYLQYYEVIGVGELSWIPLCFIILFMLTGTVAFLILPWSMNGELYPMKIRGLLSGFASFSAYALNFVIMKIYPGLVTGYGLHNTFVFFTFICLFGFGFVSLCLPETRGKTLQEIEDSFCKKKVVKNSGFDYINTSFVSDRTDQNISK